MKIARMLWMFIALLSVHVAIAHSAPVERWLLEDIAAWKPIASDGVKVRVTAEGKVMRVDFDFSGGAGHCGASLDTAFDLPENYALTFNVRGQGPANNLELKLVDESKLNVWWVNRRAFEWPSESTALTNLRRHFQFAWGPSGGKPLTRVGRIELIIAAAEGGKGTVWIDDFKFTPLPLVKPYAGTPKFGASSNWSGKLPWTADKNDATPSFVIDFGEPREIGGMVVDFTDNRAAGDFNVQTSTDGASWTDVRKVRGATGLPSELMLTDLQTRWLRLAFQGAASVKNIEILEPSDGANHNAFWKERAARAKRGIFPRTLLNEQSFWTIVGQPGDDREALINEDGQIEVDKRSFSIEPFLVREDGKLLTWADGKHQQSLRDGWAPIPSVVRRHDGLELTITALSTGAPLDSNLHASYRVRNTSSTVARGKLALAVRPIQVLPPWQDLNIVGGWTPVRSIKSDVEGVLVNGEKRIFAGGKFRATANVYDAGDPIEALASGRWPTEPAVECPQHSASGLLSWDYDLSPGASSTFVVTVPFHGINVPADRPRDGAAFDALAIRSFEDWSALVDRVTFTLPPAAKQFHDAIRATQAYIFINHDGRGFQPGSRTYERSWIRDGSMTSAAMLEFGHEELVKQFVDWFAPYQFPSGKVPCVVDRRGADPVPENDSHGQLIWLIANAHRHTGDMDLLRRQFPRVKAAVAFIESLRAQRLTDEFGPNGAARQEPNKPSVPALAFRGLVPESISHEGYSAKPMHSFWDQFFVLRGLHDAAYLAGAMNESQLAKDWQMRADDYRASLIDSIRITHKAHGIGYLPGCVELGDFDSTSSTILLWPVEEANHFPREWVDATFERYWQEFTRLRDLNNWEAYTPYELRHVNAYVRLGQKKRAWEVLSWLLSHQRPAGWRHWAEVVWREPDSPRMIGDMPHTWCGSDFLNAAAAMFVHEDQVGQRLVLFAGVPDAWFEDPDGVAFDGLRTAFGAISASAKRDGPDRIVVRIDGPAKPRGGFELASPIDRPIRSVTVDGKPAQVDARNRVQVPNETAVIELSY